MVEGLVRHPLQVDRVMNPESLNIVMRYLRGSGYAFVTPTPMTHARVNSRAKNGRARNLVDAFGWNRPFSRDLLPSGVLQPLQDGKGLTEIEDGLFKSNVRISTVDGHLLVHGSFPTDQSDSVFLGPDTYRFVSALKEEAARLKNVRRAVDIGCGTGAGGIVIAKLFPDANVFLVDINEAALELAEQNAKFSEVKNVSLAKSDLLCDVDGLFDLIIANPPYLLDANKRDYRHGGGEHGEGLSLSIVDTAVERLSSGGTLVLYTGSAIIDGHDPFQERAVDRIPQSGFRASYREIDPDVFGEELDFPAYSTADRIAAVLLTLTRE